MINTINKYPTLTTHGFGVDKDSGANIQVEREKLFNLQPEFDLCCQYLTQTGINLETQDSYKLKHDVERYARENGLKPTYIPEGALILAALYLGYYYVQIPRTTHANIGI